MLWHEYVVVCYITVVGMSWDVVLCCVLCNGKLCFALLCHAMNISRSVSSVLTCMQELLFAALADSELIVM